MRQIGGKVFNPTRSHDLMHDDAGWGWRRASVGWSFWLGRWWLVLLTLPFLLNTRGWRFLVCGGGMESFGFCFSWRLVVFILPFLLLDDEADWCDGIEPCPIGWFDFAGICSIFIIFRYCSSLLITHTNAPFLHFTLFRRIANSRPRIHSFLFLWMLIKVSILID